MRKYQTFLPVFNGFYNTIFDSDLELVSYFEQSKIDELEQETIIDNFNNNEYEHDIVKELCNAVSDYISFELKLENKITFECVVSPKEYNFTNDSANITIELNYNRFVELLDEYKVELSKMISKRYKCRDGFISYYDNDFDVWMNEIKDNENTDHYIGALLEMLLEIKDVDSESLYYSINGIVDIRDYLP